MVVPSIAEGFRDAVRTRRSLDGKEGVSFHTFTLPEDRCVRFLIKNLGSDMPESVVQKELESRDIHVQGVRQPRSGVAIMTPPSNAHPPQFHRVSGARARGVQNVINRRTLRFVSGVVLGCKGHVGIQALPALRPHAS
jgi:hypothetical protein